MRTTLLSLTLLTPLLISSPLMAEPVPTGAPNAAHQTPAFEGQTRAPQLEHVTTPVAQVVADGLEHPWGLAFLPGGDMLVTERPGRLRRITPEGDISDPVEGVPEVDARAQGGLLDVSLGPDFDTRRWVYLSYAERRDGSKNTTAVARGRLSEDGTRLTDVDFPPAAGLGIHQTLRLQTGIGHGWHALDYGRRALPARGAPARPDA